MDFIIPDGALDETLTRGMNDRPPTAHFPIDQATGATYKRTAQARAIILGSAGAADLAGPAARVWV